MTIKDFLRAKPKQNHTIFGAGPCGVGHGDICFLEEFLRIRTEWKHIVELGTGGGLTTLWLANAAAIRGGKVRSFDSKKVNPYYGRFWPAGVVDFYFADIHEDSSVQLICGWIGQPETLLIIDDGDKPKSLARFAPFVAAGNGVIVHDWGREIDAERAAIVQGDGWTPLLHQFAENFLSSYRAWVRE